MKSIKPGRGPSIISSLVGIFMIGFGIVWTILAMQANTIFALFGVFWTGIVIIITIYNFKNATRKNRYSVYDITDANEEPDPLNDHFETPQNTMQETDHTDIKFCPYCGTPVAVDFKFCSHCGKKLP